MEAMDFFVCIFDTQVFSFIYKHIRHSLTHTHIHKSLLLFFYWTLFSVKKNIWNISILMQTEQVLLNSQISKGNINIEREKHF